MATYRDRVVELLKAADAGLTGREIRERLGMNAAHANQICRKLARWGAVERRKVNGIYHNFLVDASKVKPSRQINPDEMPWFWEGHVQDRVVDYLIMQGYTILQAVDTASREPGVDVIAEKDGRQLWVTVKGYPKGTKKTNPRTQAKHWFSSALFDVLRYRGDDADVPLAVALPDFERYRKLSKKVEWFQPVAPFTYYWVSEDGSVNEE